MGLQRKQPFLRASTPGSSLPALPNLPPSLAEDDGFLEWDRGQRLWWDDVRAAMVDALGTNDRRFTELKKSVTVGDAALSASIAELSLVIVSADEALAVQISDVEAAYQAADTIISASVTTEASARVAADGAIHAHWGVNIDVNGRIAGRINLDGTNASSTFLVAVDKLVVENANGTVTAMDIRTGGKIVFGADVQSDTYSAGVSGWYLNRNTGNAEFNDVVVRGSIYSTVGSIGGFTLAATKLSAGTGSGYIAVDSSGIIEMGNYASTSNDYTLLDSSELFIKHSAGRWGHLNASSALLRLGSWSYSGGYNFAVGAELDGVNGKLVLPNGGAIDIGNVSLSWVANGVLEIQDKVRLQSGGSGWLEFGNSNNRIEENYGIKLISQGSTWPIRISGGAIMMNGDSDLGSSYFTAGRIYWSSGVYLYESGGILYLKDSNGDRALT